MCHLQELNMQCIFFKPYSQTYGGRQRGLILSVLTSGLSLFRALGQWGWSKKQVRDARDLVKKLEKAQEGEPVSIVLKTSFRPLLKRQRFKDDKCQNVGIFRVELLACVSLFQSMFWCSCSRFTCRLCRLKSLRILKPTPQNAVFFARMYSTFKKINYRMSKNITFVYQSTHSVAMFASFKWHQQAPCKMYGID